MTKGTPKVLHYLSVVMLKMNVEEATYFFVTFSINLQVILENIPCKKYYVSLDNYHSIQLQIFFQSGSWFF